MLPCVFPHSGYTEDMVGVDVDMLDFDLILYHIDQHIVAGFYSAEIVIQTDVADLLEKMDQLDAIFIIPPLFL